jgi:hypothetical protein
MMGKYGRPEFEPEFSIMFQDIKTISVKDFLDGITRDIINSGTILIILHEQCFI